MRLIDPGSTLAISIDWSDWLGTETITTSTWSVTPTATVTGTDKTDTAASCFLSACVHGEVYRLTHQIVTSGGQTEQRMQAVRCLQR